MKIFIIGLPKSGRTTIGKSIADHFKGHYIDATSWIKSTFREQRKDEHPHRFDDEYDRYISIRRMVNPWFIIDHVREMLKANEHEKIFVIDGIISPKDFTELFDYRQDVVLFLEQTDSLVDFRDHENIGISTIRDYCFWLSSASLLPKHKWLEYKFKIPGDQDDFVKELGSKNTVFITRSINRVISHVKDQVQKCIVYPTV